MEINHINQIVGRNTIEQTIIQLLQSFDDNCRNIQFKKGIYIYGASGSGKTFFIMDILKRMNYDVIKYDASDTRNKNLIDSITSNNISNNNVLNMMYRRKQKIAILMDEIEAMNSGDKNGITSLIKLIRQKKTKRQRLESQTYNPIICISNYYVDKKIKELMKVCHVFELKTPIPTEIRDIIHYYQPEMPEEDKSEMVQYVQGDLRRLYYLLEKNKTEENNWKKITATFSCKTFNDDSKKITKRILDNHIDLDEHKAAINETDRTIVALLWHENIVDRIGFLPLKQRFNLYYQILENICFADYIDRITFQNQIWQFNEMSSLIKTMYNNKLFHLETEAFEKANENKNRKERKESQEIRFTKILTKYSTEYNNDNFVTSLCNKMEMDRKDVMSFFQEMRIVNNTKEGSVMNDMIEQATITKLDIKRFYRYLDQNEKKEGAVVASTDDEELDENEEEPQNEYDLYVE